MFNDPDIDPAKEPVKVARVIDGSLESVVFLRSGEGFRKKTGMGDGKY